MPHESTKILLPEKEMPRQWYNILPDLPRPLSPPVSPATGKAITPDELNAIFPMGLIMQEVSQDNYIDIPDEILNIYRLWRPSPLVRARRLDHSPPRIRYGEAHDRDAVGERPADNEQAVGHGHAGRV